MISFGAFEKAVARIEAQHRIIRVSDLRLAAWGDKEAMKSFQKTIMEEAEKGLKDPYGDDSDRIRADLGKGI